MRKILVFIAGTMITGSLLAGGLVTNTNQSAAWVRLPSRNASTEVDAVYYNPAGLMKLDNGFHLSLSNQTIFQTREITSSYPYLNDGTYKGTVKAPLFPSVYAVYKMDKLAISFGFNPVGGGGGAAYDKGLPSFEMSQSDLVPVLSGAPYSATDYRMNVYFKGSSIFFGTQGALSYKINDWLSVAAGVRYVSAKNTYEGYLKDIQVNTVGGWLDGEYIMDQTALSATNTANNLQGLITAGTLVATDPLAPAFASGLVAFGVNPTGFTNQIGVGAFNQVAGKYTLNANMLADQEADATQKGSGITPIISVNISPSDKLNIAIKYEMATKLELTNETKKDIIIGYTSGAVAITQFPDGEKTRNDMPAMLAMGVDYKVSPNLKVSAGLNYYFDKSADFGHKVDNDTLSSTPTIQIKNSDIIANNGMALQAGLEYNISDNLLISGGYAWGNLGVNARYQSDLTYANATHTIGLGGAYTIKDKIRINLGAAYTMYVTNEKSVGHRFPTGAVLIAKESYTKNSVVIGVGLDFRF